MKFNGYVISICSVAVVFTVFVAGCSQVVTKKTLHVCKYTKVTGRFDFEELYGYTLVVDGKEYLVEPSGYEFETYRALASNYSIVSDDYSYAKKNNKIFAIGKISTCGHHRYTTNDEGAKVDEEYRNFIFESWYIKKPFKETIWKDKFTNSNPRFIERTALKMSDFDPYYLKRNKIHLTQKDLGKYVR